MALLLLVILVHVCFGKCSMERTWNAAPGSAKFFIFQDKTNKSEVPITYPLTSTSREDERKARSDSGNQQCMGASFAAKST